MIYVLAVAAAALFAAGSVVQQRVAGQSPPERAFSARLLLWLVRQPGWLLGVAISVGGNILAALALGKGGVTLAEPLFTIRLLFALPLAAVWSRLAVPRRDWAGAVAAVAGLAAFIAVGDPRRGHPLQASGRSWAEAIALLAALTIIAVVVARRMTATRAAAVLAVGAGLLFGLQSSLTETAIMFLHRQGTAGLLTHWQPYAVAAAALVATVLLQNAYGIAPLHSSFPFLVTAEPLAGLLLGVIVLHGALRVSPSAYAGEIGGLVVMVLGVWLLAHSPLVTGQAHLLQRRRDEALAYHVLGRLEAVVQAAEEGGAADSRGRVTAHGRRATQLRDSLAELDGLLADMAKEGAAERDRLRKLPPRERMALAPLEQELDDRQQQLASRVEALRSELRTNGGLAALAGRRLDSLAAGVMRCPAGARHARSGRAALCRPENVPASQASPGRQAAYGHGFPEALRPRMRGTTDNVLAQAAHLSSSTTQSTMTANRQALAPSSSPIRACFPMTLLPGV